jgi:uncharacterized protein
VLVACRLDGGCGCAGSGAMGDIWQAAEAGDVGEVERLLGQDLGLLNATDNDGMTALMWASSGGHVGVVRSLLDQGAAINECTPAGSTALMFACSGGGHTPVVRLLLERGADPTIVNEWGANPLITASYEGHLEVVRSLLGHSSAKATINQRDGRGETALWRACYRGHGGVVRALLEGGADPTIASNDGTTPTAIAKQVPDQDDSTLEEDRVSAEGRRECVTALEVRP